VPPDVYGWETTNYNGVNLTYRDDIQGWAVKSNVYIGNEKVKDSPFGKLESYYLKGNPIDWEWSNMRGIDLEVNRDWFTARIAYNESQQRRVQITPNGPIQEMPSAEFGSSSKQNSRYFRSLWIKMIFSADWKCHKWTALPLILK